MPTVMRIGGNRFFFFSNEGSEAPHIHVECRENYAKFWLSPVTLARSVGFSARELTELREITQQNCQALEEKWHEYFGR